MMICPISRIVAFQSTHPCGVRPGSTEITFTLSAVSIHAPVWGATIYRSLTSCIGQFQSTHPCGVRRQNPQATAPHHKCFNPRTRVGCDNSRLVFSPNTNVSIHAPVWGATGFFGRHPYLVHVSIHAPVWGATPCRTDFSNVGMFQSTHPCGVRPPIL